MVVERPVAEGSHSVSTAIAYGFRSGRYTSPASCATVEMSPVLLRHARLARQSRWNAAPELLAMQDVQHLARELGGERALLADEAEQAHEPAGRDTIVDPVLERELVLDAAPEVEPLEPELLERALHHVETDEVEQQIRCEIAARGDHVLGELGDAQRSPDLAMHLAVGIAVHAHAVGRAVVGAQEPVAHVHARLWQELAAMDRPVDADEDGELDRARGVKPPIAVVDELATRLEVGDGDREPARADSAPRARRIYPQLAWRA